MSCFTNSKRKSRKFSVNDLLSWKIGQDAKKKKQTETNYTEEECNEILVGNSYESKTPDAQLPQLQIETLEAAFKAKGTLHYI